MTASVLECLYKSFGWTLINSEYIHLSSFFLTRTPGYLRAVRHTVAVEVPRANVLVVQAAVVSWAGVTVRGGGLGCAREMCVRML